MKSTVEKAAEITKHDAKTIQDENDFQMEVPSVDTEKELKEDVVDSKKEYGVFESMGEVPLKPLLIFSLHVKESDHDLLIFFVDQSLMTASDGIKKLDGFNFLCKST